MVLSFENIMLSEIRQSEKAKKEMPKDMYANNT